MTVVRARLAPGRSISEDDFTDITTTPVESIGFDTDGILEVTFIGVLTEDETDRVRARITSTDTEAEGIRVQAVKAHRANAAYLNLTAPTNTEVRAQVAALTRQVNALIRLAVK